MSARGAAAAVVGVIAAAVGGSVADNQLSPEAATAADVQCANQPLPGATVGSLESGATGSTPQRYAPLVFLHPNEKLLPMRADCFVSHSSLEFAQGRRKQTVVVQRGDLSAETLVHPGYASGGYTTRDLTRPFEKRRMRALDGRRGFYLDVDDRFRGGAPSTETTVFFAGTPVYYEYIPSRYVTYWFFYGYSAPAALLVRPLRRAGVRVIGHEADWEGMSIKLNRFDRAVSVAYFAHGEDVQPLPWAKVKKLDGHPIVFSALGSHASYTTPGTQRSNLDVTAGGPIWASWLLIADARVQPWYGYGGAWGVARAVPSLARAVAERFGKHVGDGEFTGPLGPGFKGSPFKAPAKATSSSPVG